MVELQRYVWGATAVVAISLLPCSGHYLSRRLIFLLNLSKQLMNMTTNGDSNAGDDGVSKWQQAERDGSRRL